MKLLHFANTLICSKDESHTDCVSPDQENIDASRVTVYQGISIKSTL